MCFKKKNKIVEVVNSRFKLGDYVDFFRRDDLYFGHVSNIYLDDNKQVLYDIDIAGQCPATIVGVEEEKVVRIHE